MKEIKAFIPATRAADVLEALKEAEEAGGGVLNLAAFPVEGLPDFNPDSSDAHYSMELGGTVIREIKVEILCRDEEVASLTRLVKASVGTGARGKGWLLVTAVESAEPLGAMQAT